jgi:hypothetical protein
MGEKMESSQIKPKVFLSHSKQDEKFVKRIYASLLKSQCTPWLDTEEIRDGKPWLDVIFEEGIPACDVLIVYLTQNSINSKMVQKELNAAFVEQLRDNKIQVLPYVSESSLRSKLRSDIASLQCREWNSKNYSSILPSIVAEIWRSNLEKKVRDSVLREKGLRLELEHKITTLEASSETKIFSGSENMEFGYLQEKLNQILVIPATLNLENGSTNPTEIQINIVGYLLDILNTGRNTFDVMHFLNDLRNTLNKELKPAKTKSISFDGRREIYELQKIVIKYGLVDNHLIQSAGRNDFLFQITQKYRRFAYWLEYNKKTNKGNISIKNA